MRKLLFVFVAVLWVVAGIQLVQNLNQEDETQIVQAFNKTNCMNAMSKVQVNGPLRVGYITISEQKNILKKIANELGITENYQVTEEKEGAQSTVLLCKEAARAKTIMKIVTVESERADNVVESVQYLVIEIDLYDQLECAIPYKENLQNIVREYGITTDVTLQFSGILPRKLSDMERKSIAKQLLESISAEEKSKYEEGIVYTVYAHTDLIEESQEINGKAVNVSVTINYNEELNQTGLYLATPFLNEDY